MKISEVIEELNKDLEEHGDVEVFTYYDDGGYNVYSETGLTWYNADEGGVVIS